jgi:hypothetical protein
MGEPVIRHIGSTFVFGVVGKTPKEMRLICPLSIQPTVIGGQDVLRLDLNLLKYV